MVRIPDRFAERLDAVDSPRPRFSFVTPVEDAAVVALLIPGEGLREQDPQVVLIERAGSMRNHAGQVALPGGKPDETDGTLVNTALREASEEVGLPQLGADVLGRLAPVPTPSGFCIWPYVAWAPQGWSPRNTSEDEVAEVMTPRLSVLARAHTSQGKGVWKGFEYEKHSFAVHDPPVWGATARIVWDLLERIRR
ncbi:MAG: CoA pyrophosphatase [Nannocystaceae bacterium]|nr:CoA pyrophosphatase [Nannocystaceae bacterium]